MFCFNANKLRPLMCSSQVVKVRINYAFTLIQFIREELPLQLTVSFSFCLIFATSFFIVFFQECRLKL